MVPYGPLWSPGHSVGLPLEVADLNSWGLSVLIGAGTDWHWESSNFNDSVLWRRRVDQIFRHPVGRKSNLQSAGRNQKDGQKLKVIAGHHLPSSIFLSLTSGIKKLMNYMNSCCTQNGFWCVWKICDGPPCSTGGGNWKRRISLAWHLLLSRPNPFHDQRHLRFPQGKIKLDQTAKEETWIRDAKEMPKRYKHCMKLPWKWL